MESHEEGGTQDRTPVGCNADEDMEHVGIEGVKDSIDNKNPMTSSEEHMEEGYLQKGSNVAASSDEEIERSGTLESFENTGIMYSEVVNNYIIRLLGPLEISCKPFEVVFIRRKKSLYSEKYVFANVYQNQAMGDNDDMDGLVSTNPLYLDDVFFAGIDRNTGKITCA